MKRRFQKVSVLMGGFSAEKEISVRSGQAVARGLRARGYEVAEVNLLSPAFELPRGTDVVFVALHGEYGEDGGVQAELERRGVPYTGSGPASCRVAFDKRLTRERLQARGLPVAPGRVLGAPAGRCPLPLPVVVKPTRQGSSVGCHRVFREEEWPAALRDALGHGEALVEAFIPGRELTVGVVGERVLPVIEIRAPDGYYDFRAKYTAGVTEYLCPAPLAPAEAERVGALGGEVFRALDARGLGRVDIRMTPEGGCFVLELNSIPGFTETSLLPKAAAAAGMGFPELCERILNLAATA